MQWSDIPFRPSSRTLRQFAALPRSGSSLASASALVLLLPLSPVRVRVPAMAAMSAADWACDRATAIRPTSIPRATNAMSPTRQTVTRGRTAPGRRAVLGG